MADQIQSAAPNPQNGHCSRVLRELNSSRLPMNCARPYRLPVGQDRTGDGLWRGHGQPVEVYGNPAEAGRLAAALRAVPGITAVTQPVTQSGHAYLEGTREEAQRHGPRTGALTGLTATGGVITSAGAVLAGTFAVLGTLPVTFLTELGFAVAFGVLLDTLVVRSVLVTALNLDLGRWVWWPSRLAREPSQETEPLGDQPAPVG
jgi:hypothetical protein